VPQQMGNAGTKARAWVQHVMLSLNAQAKKTRELEEFRQGFCSRFDPGEPLDMATRRRMETFFGYKLEKVRIHRGQGAEEASRRLGARALTIRGHIFAPQQNLDTSNTQGLRLLAHELTHVIQQTQPHRLPQGQMTDRNTSSAPAALPRSHSNTEMVLLAPARSSPVTTNPQLREAQAQASEQLVAKASADNQPKSPPEIDCEAVADKVYCLMQNDVRLERERAT